MNKQFFFYLLISIACTFVSCSKDDETSNNTTNEAYVENIIQNMTLREKVGQMFWLRPENLIPGVTEEMIANAKNYAVTRLTDEMIAADSLYPVGGIILYAHNCVNPSQLRSFVPQIKALPYSPMLCIDEEGGRVARLANNEAFGLNKYSSMTWLCQNGGEQAVYNASSYIGSYLGNYGFDIDFAPVADVNSNPDNPVIGARAFSSDPDSVATMVCSYLHGLRANNIIGCIKHFPGHGDTKTDTHLGYAETQKTWEQMLQCEMIPFKAGINDGVEIIMTAHITAPNVDASNVPSTLSKIILQDKLRGELGYQNLIVTDAMEMGAIAQNYPPGEAAVESIVAGVDVILGPINYRKAFNAVLDAVNNGTIPESRINESVRRILLMKKRKGKI